MAKCFICEKDTVAYQYVSVTAADGRRLFCRFDQLHRLHSEMPDFEEPWTVRWNPGPKGDELSLEVHRALANQPRMRALPGIVRVENVRRNQLRQKLSQFMQIRERLLNP